MEEYDEFANLEDNVHQCQRESFLLVRSIILKDCVLMTRVAGIEPTQTVLKTDVLPLNYTPEIKIS